MKRLDFIICWFSLYLIPEKSIKIFFYEIIFREKVEPHYQIAQILTNLNEKHVIWSVSCFGTELFIYGN